MERETVLPGGQGDASHPQWPYGQQNRELGPWGAKPDAYSGAVGSYGLCFLHPGAWAVSGKVNVYMQVSVRMLCSAALWLFRLKVPSGSEGIQLSILTSIPTPHSSQMYHVCNLIAHEAQCIPDQVNI